MSLPPEILKYIVSDYIEYQELVKLIMKVPDLYLNPKRIKVEENFYHNKQLAKRVTYIDSYIKISQDWHENGEFKSKFTIHLTLNQVPIV